MVTQIPAKTLSEGQRAQNFLPFENVRVKFRRLDRSWTGVVIKDNGGATVTVYADHGLFNISEVERERISVIPKGW